MNNLQYLNISFKNTIKIIIVVLILFLISGIIYKTWVFNHKKEQSKLLETTPGVEKLAVSVIPKVSEQYKPELPADWRGYDNSSVGYTIYYPKDFVFERTEGSKDKFTREAITLKRPANEWKTLYIFIEVEAYPSDVSPREWADLYYPIEGSSSFEDITIGYMRGIQRDLSSPKSTIGEVILTKGNKVARINYVTEEVQRRNDVIGLINQILNNLRLY